MLSQSVLPNSNVVLIINSMMQFNKDKYDEFPERTKLGQERLNQTYQNDLDLLDVRLNPPKDGTLNKDGECGRLGKKPIEIFWMLKQS